MGYESKLFIVDKYGIQFASLDMCKMGYGNGWQDLFDKPYDKGLYCNFGGMEIPDEYKEYYPNIKEIPDVVIKEDRYGNKLKYANAEDVYTWCKTHKKQMNYWMVDLLESILKTCLKSGIEAKVIHFGH